MSIHSTPSGRTASITAAVTAGEAAIVPASPTNTLGVKGVGEAATIACSPAIVNAVVDALRPLGITYIDMPLTPMRVWQAIQEAQGSGGGPAATEQGKSLDDHGGGAAGSGPTSPDEGGGL